MAENPKLNPEQDDPEQSRRFMEMAKLLGGEDAGASFEAALSAISVVTAQKGTVEQPVCPVPDGD